MVSVAGVIIPSLKNAIHHQQESERIWASFLFSHYEHLNVLILCCGVARGYMEPSGQDNASIEGARLGAFRRIYVNPNVYKQKYKIP